MEDIGGLQKYLDSLPENERKIRHLGFSQLIAGNPCTLETIRNNLGLSEEEILDTIATMAKRGTLIWDHETNSLAATGGLSRFPTSHALFFHHHQMYAWCAADAVGIPAALALDATIQSSCHLCQSNVHIVLQEGKLQSADPASTCVWVIDADPAQSVSGHT